jgi:hypothetical protein
MDVMSILLKKRQVVTRYEVSVSADQFDERPADYLGRQASGSAA